MESEELKIVDSTREDTSIEAHEASQPSVPLDPPASTTTDRHTGKSPDTDTATDHEEAPTAPENMVVDEKISSDTHANDNDATQAISKEALAAEQTLVNMRVDDDDNATQAIPKEALAAEKTLVNMRADTLAEVRREPTPRPPLMGNRTHVVTAESIEAEQVPTIPLDSLQTINALQPEISVRSVGATSTVSIPEPLVVQPSEYRRSLGEWLQIWREGMRLNVLPLSLAPILLGTALAWTQTLTRQTPFGQFHLLSFVGLLVAVLLLQVGANLVNDYYDYLRGIDTSNTLGPGGLIQEGQIRPTRVISVGLTLLTLGGLVGLITIWRSGALAVVLTLLIILAAYFYSATSYALSRKGLGELVSFFVFGPLLTLGAYMIQTGGQVNARVFIYSLSLGFLAVAALFANNMRDLEGDEHAGKRTLANLMGITLSRIAYVILLLAAYAIIVPQGIMHGSPHLILVTLWTLPSLAVAISGTLRTKAPAGFHLVMRQTLKLELAFVILLILALIVTAVIPVVPQIQFSILKI